jgi:hypothetical protein
MANNSLKARVRVAVCVVVGTLGAVGCADIEDDASELAEVDGVSVNEVRWPRRDAGSQVNDASAGDASTSQGDAALPGDASAPVDSAVADGSVVDSAVIDSGALAVDAAASQPDASTPPAPSGICAVPAAAQLEDVSHPTTVVGSGSPASCTSSAFVAAVATGGVITFNCGASPVTITLDQTAKVFNDKSQKVVIDGGGKVTLSGGGKVRILYQNTCDSKQVYTTAHCDNQEFPQLTVQNLTFVDGNAKSEALGGGGAVYAQGGRLKVLNSRFYNNVCADVGPDVGGGAVRALMQYQGLPAYVVGSVFGGQEGRGNVCSNGGALSSIGVSYTVLNSTLSYNKAIGNGANPAKAGTPGGGSGGAIYNDGNTFTLDICGSTLDHNTANEGGGAIFYVSNDRSGTLKISDSTLQLNPSGKFETLPGIFVLAKGDPVIVRSTIK